VRTDWSALLPDEDYRFHFGVKTGAPADFFAPTAAHEMLLRERAHWLQADAPRYAALRDEGIPALNETLALARQWGTLPDAVPGADAGDFQRLLDLGKQWEADFVLLRPDAQKRFCLVGGCVCFPSAWRLTDKVGLPLEAIHAPVPNLNPTLGTFIHQFLSRLRPGLAALRSNWGLSRSPVLNQHLDQDIPRLVPPLTLADVWLRSENQALVALPQSGAILFGIRLEIHSLTAIKAHPAAARGLARALRTMPPAMVEYKNLAAARETIIAQLEN
jgi:hypothetical protein